MHKQGDSRLLEQNPSEELLIDLQNRLANFQNSLTKLENQPNTANSWAGSMNQVNERSKRRDELLRRIARVEKRIREVQIGIASSQTDIESTPKNEGLLKDVEAVSKEVQEIATQTDNLLQTTMKLPSKKLTEVQLVPIHLLEQLERNRSDENRMSSFASITFGAVLGIGMNWITGGVINSAGIIAAILLGLATGVFVFEAIRANNRAEQDRKKMLEDAHE